MDSAARIVRLGTTLTGLEGGNMTKALALLFAVALAGSA